MQSIRHFTDLLAWQEARKFAVAAYEVTKAFPAIEQFGLTDQMRRSALSVPANIAEGFARRTSKDKRNFYQTALASLSETESHMIIACDLGFLGVQALHELQSKSNDVGRLISGLIKSAADKV